MYVTANSARIVNSCRKGYKNTVNAAGGVSAVADRNAKIPLWRVIVGASGFEDVNWALEHHCVFFDKDEWLAFRNRARLDLVQLLAPVLVTGEGTENTPSKTKRSSRSSRSSRDDDDDDAEAHDDGAESDEIPNSDLNEEDDNDGIYRDSRGELPNSDYSRVRDLMIEYGRLDTVIQSFENLFKIESDEGKYIEDVLAAKRKLASLKKNKNTSSYRISDAKTALSAAEEKAEEAKSTHVFSQIAEFAPLRELMVDVRKLYPVLNPEQRVEFWRRFVSLVETRGINLLLLLKTVNSSFKKETAIDLLQVLFSDRQPDWQQVTCVMHFVMKLLGEFQGRELNSLGMQYVFGWFAVPAEEVVSCVMQMLSKTKIRTSIQGNDLTLHVADANSMTFLALGMLKTCDKVMSRLNEMEAIRTKLNTPSDKRVVKASLNSFLDRIYGVESVKSLKRASIDLLEAAE